MKRLLLLASIASAAFVAAPLMPASAATTGACELAGIAHLEPELNAELKSTTFSFEGTGGSCVETGSTVKKPVEKSEVHGKGELSCPAGQNIAALKGEVSGTGAIKVAGIPEQKFNFKLVAAAGSVTFTAEGEEVKAAGDAEFLTHQKAVEKCAKLKAEELEFTAAIAGTI
jgi:hypothetical protein